MRFNTTRERYVPTGATKVADKKSDAVAFVYTTGRGRPAAVAFHGKASKPVWHYSYADEGGRERAIKIFFEARRRVAAMRAERRADAKRPHTMEVGHVLVASWGYEQTNVSFFQVTALVGTRTVEVRAIGQGDASTGREPWATGKAVPAIDRFTGEPMRRRVNGCHRSVRIDDVRTAHLWDGRPQSWTAYA